MSPAYAMLARFDAQSEECDALASILLEAAELVENDASCLLYLVSRPSDAVDCRPAPGH